jgi:3-oxoadipate enol-lactonase
MNSSHDTRQPSVIRCAYSIQGEGPTIVMVHGIGSHMQGWNSVVARLKAEYRCVTFDLRGHGVSPVPKGKFGIDELVADLEALRQHLELDQFHLMGHSLGAMIAASYSRRFPKHVLSLGLFSTAAFRKEEDKARIRAVVAEIRANGLRASLDHLMRRWYTDHFMETHPEFVAQRRDHLLRMNQEVLLNVFEIYSQTEMGPWLHEIKVPTLVVTGENDPGCNPRLNFLINNAIPNARLVILKDLKHSILVEGAHSLTDTIRQFLKSKCSE